MSDSPAATQNEGLSRPHLRVATSTVALVASSAVSALLGVIAIYEITHILGSKGYGYLGIVINFISISMLFADLGINTYSGREIARDRSQAAAILSQNLGLRLVLSVIMIPAVIGIGILVYPHEHGPLIEGIVIVSLAIPFEAMRAVTLSYYVASIQNYKTAMIGVFTTAIYVSGVVISLHLGYGLTGCFLSYLGALVLTGFLAYFSVRRTVKFIPRIVMSAWRELLQNSLGIGAIQIVNVLYLRTNILLLSVMTNAQTVAQYVVAASIVTFLLVIPNAYMTSLLPLIVTAVPDKIAGLINTASSYMALIGALAVAGTITVATDLVSGLAPHAQFGGSIEVLSILSASVLFTCLTSVFTYASFARDHHRGLLFISGGGLLTNVLLDLELIPAFGARGAAIATVIVEALLLLGAFLMFRRRVGRHVTVWARLARIYLVGGVVAVVGRLAIDPALPAGKLRLAVGLVAIPVLFLALAVPLRCLPTPLRSIYRGLRQG
jgi:O-antigen/teichoic acid export membrane protein